MTKTQPRFLNEPIYQPQRKLTVIVIGAGASGLFLTYKLQRHFGDIEIKVFEKNAGVSGTWYENRYPGCACDIPAHNYTYSFEPNPKWTTSYASAPEIRQYFVDFCTRHGLEKHIALQHQVTKVEWQEKEAKWLVDVQDLQTNTAHQHTAHIVVNASGYLNHWTWPDIPGLHSFQGKIVHSAAWDQDVDLTGKVVGLIGNGASGIQIMPSIRPQVQKLHHFVRQPQWIAPPVGDELKNYTEDEISKFQSDPAYHRNVRRQTERKLNGYFASLIRGSEMQNIAREQLTALMTMQLQGHEQTQSLIPDFPWGCRRPTPGIGYLEALRDPKVEPVIGNIKQVTEKGLETEDGKFYPLDVLICATGFDTSYLPHFPIIGDQGKSLAEQWKDEVQGYLGISVPHFPNYFSLLGPNCPVGNGPILIAVEQQASYITQMLSKFQKENARSFAVSAKATKDFNAWKDNYMDYTVWTNGCRSWYQDRKNGNRISALWPGSTLHYIEAIQAPRYEDWQWDYQPGSNTWSFLGNGFSSAEGRGGELGWYISSWDGSPIDPCLKQEGKL